MKEFISVWGGIASIVSLSVLVISAAIKYLHKQRQLIIEQKILIDKALDQIETVAKEATTQGRTIKTGSHKRTEKPVGTLNFGDEKSYW